MWSGVGAATLVVRWLLGVRVGGSASAHTSNAKWPAGPVATDVSAVSFKMAAKAQRRRRRAGAGCGRASSIPRRADNGGIGEPLARWSVGNVCVISVTSLYNIQLWHI